MRGIRSSTTTVAIAAACLLVAGSPAHAARNKLATLQAPSIAGPTSAGIFTAPSKRPTYREGQLIVRFEPGTSGSARAAIDSKKGAKALRFLGLPRTYLVGFDKHKDVAAQKRSYEKEGAVQYASPNFIRHLTSTYPNDTNFAEQWALENGGQTVNGVAGTNLSDINAPLGWDSNTGSSSVVVGVVDTGIDYSNPELSPNIWANPGETGAGKETNGLDDDGNGRVDDFRGYDFVSGDNDPMDGSTQGHGTYMSGVIGAQGNNGLGTAGVAWNVRLAPLRACDPSPLVGCDDSYLIPAFTYAGQMGMKIVNASLSGPGNNPVVSAAIATYPGTLFAVSAGNGGPDLVGDDNDSTPQYPCAYSPSNIVCVAATDQHDQLASFSDYGATTVDLAAPGTNIIGPWLGNELTYLGGTSPATAYVAGAAAVVSAQDPGISAVQLGSRLAQFGTPLPSLSGKTVSGSRLSLYAAMPSPLAYAEGSLDTGFDGDGKVETDIVGANDDEGRAMAVQTDGKIIVAGGQTVDFYLARYNPDGSLDTSFDGDGKVTTDFAGAQDFANGVAVQSSTGKIVVAGEACDGIACNFAVARYNSNGSLDTSFDTDGKATTDFTPSNGSKAAAVVIQGDGRIVAAGTRELSGSPGADFALVRYNVNGSLDTGFDSDGKVTTDFSGADDRNTALRLQSDGRIVVAGTSNYGTAAADYALARYNTNGSLDTAFDGDGKQTTDLAVVDEATSLRIMGNGRIVVGGAAGLQQNGKVVFSTARDGNNEIYSMNGDGTGLTRLTNHAAVDLRPAPSPDGLKIAFASLRDDPDGCGVGTCNYEIYTMNPNGTDVTRLTADVATATDISPEWSPDGTKITFESERDGNREIYTMNADGTNQTRLTNNSVADQSPAWSPDGTKIAFDTARDGNQEIYTINANGTSPTRITNTADGDFDPEWSPDGTKLVFVEAPGLNREIFTINANGTGQTQLTFDASEDQVPSWSPDGTKITWRADRDGNGEIYTMNADGSNQTNITNNGSQDTQPDWGASITLGFGVVRYNSTGSLDSGFGSGGKVTTTFSGQTSSFVRALAIQQDQKLVAAGGASLASPMDFALARYNLDGTLDTSFGTGGRVTTNFSGGSGDDLWAMSVQTDGKIVVAGSTQLSGRRFALARYNAAGAIVNVAPNADLDPSGQTITVTGGYWAPNDSIQIQQCRSGTCLLRTTTITNSSGDFTTNVTPNYTIDGNVTECEDPNCNITATSTAFGTSKSTRISFKQASSTVGTPSAGAISQAQTLTLGQSVTDGAVVTGNGAGGSPTGTVSFHVCGPVSSPATCAGGTQVGATKTLAPGAGNTATATSDPFTPSQVGRYCFRAVHSGGNKYRSSSDSSKGQCIMVTQPAALVVGTNDYYRLPPGSSSFIVPAPGVLQNDLRPDGESVTATLVLGPQHGDFVAGLNANGSFNYAPDSGYTGPDEFTYQVQGPSGTAVATVNIDVTAANDTDANRSRANRSRANRSRTLDEAQLITYVDCRARWVSVNPQVTLSEDTFIQLTAALYDASGARIVTNEGYLAYGDFFADFTNPLTLTWPLWSEPAPAGGDHVEILLEADPADDPTNADAYTVTATVPCKT